MAKWIRKQDARTLLLVVSIAFNVGFCLAVGLRSSQPTVEPRDEGRLFRA